MVEPDSPGQGGVVSNGFDADRNLNLITLVDAGINAPGGQSQIAIEWRADRRPLRIRRPWGGDTKFEYSDVGRLAGKSTFVDGEWKKTHIEHDLMGRVTAVLKPNGMGKRLTYHPDGARRSIRTEKDWHDPSEWDSYAELEFLNGNLRRIRDEVHSMQPEVYIRDLHGKVREIRYPDGERFVMIRDVRGRPESEQYWSPELTQLRKFSYVYDLSNRLISVRENERELLRVEYVGNRMDRLIYGNGVDISYFYDPVTGATTGFTATNDVGEIVASSVVDHTLCSIVLPTSSCITALTTSNIGVQGVSYEEYQFEDVGSRRLIADSTGVISPLDGYYSHDELSNALKSPQGTYTYNPERNRLLEINDDFGTVMTYEYDDAGFVTRRNDIPIEWNGGGQITSVGTETEIEWDALRRKVAATIEGVTYSWRYGGRIREAADGLSTTLDLGWAVGDLINGTYVYRVYDMRGNTKLLLDDLGEVSAHYHYSGYGPEGMDGEDRTSRSFARGTEIGDLIVIGHRVYDPVAQRFLRPDPINQWINQFVYTLGDPVNTQDPTGEEFSMTVSGSIEPKVGSDGKSGWVGVKFGGKITFKWGDRGTLPEPAPPMDPAPEPIVIDGVDDDGEKGGGGTGLTGGGGGTGSPNPGSGISCGLGFEIVPLLVGWFALRSRRQSWTRSARS
jgi:RHS repeat-associated protein